MYRDKDEVEHPVSEDVESQKTTEKPRSTTYLDGLRGLAALCVFNQHLIGGNEHHHGYNENGYSYFISFPFIRVFYSGGAAAVAIFFVLSGFVLSQSTVKKFSKGQRRKCQTNLISAIIRRPIRLYLPCWNVALVIALLMQLPGKIYPDLPWNKAEDNLGAQLVHLFVETIKYFNPFQTHGWKYGVYLYDIVLWTIPVELKGSMLIYVLTTITCFGMSDQYWASGFLLLTTITLIQIGWWWGGCFVAGLLLTFVEVYSLDKRWKKMSLPLFIMGWYLLSQPTEDGHPEWSLDTPGWHLLTLCIPSVYDGNAYYRFWQSYGAIFVTYAVLRLRPLQNIFNTRSMRYLGKVSFMLYLVHLPLVYVVDDRMKRLFGEITLGSEPQWGDNALYIPEWGPKGLDLRWDIRYIIMLPLSLSVAHVGTIYLDEPCVRLGKRLGQSLGLEEKR